MGPVARRVSFIVIYLQFYTLAYIAGVLIPEIYTTNLNILVFGKKLQHAIAM